MTVSAKKKKTQKHKQKKHEMEAKKNMKIVVIEQKLRAESVHAAGWAYRQTLCG